MNWTKFVKIIICGKKCDSSVDKSSCQNNISSEEKQKAERSIALRLNALFGCDLAFSEELKKYYVHNPIKLDDNVESSSDSDKQTKEDIAGVAAAFWQFVNISLNNPKAAEKQKKSIKKFIFELKLNMFKSERERSEYIKKFCSTNKCLDSHYYSYYMEHDHYTVPYDLTGRIQDIEAFVKNKFMAQIFDAYNECLDEWETEIYLQRFGNHYLFENASDEEMEFYEFLLNNFPRYSEGTFGGFSTLDAIKGHHWEKFDIDVRKKLVEHLEKLREKDDRTWRYTNSDSLEYTGDEIGLLILRILHPEIGLICKDIGILCEMLVQDPELAEERLGIPFLQGFYSDLHKILTKNFSDKMMDYGEVFIDEINIVPYEKQFEAAMTE